METKTEERTRLKTEFAQKLVPPPEPEPPAPVSGPNAKVVLNANQLAELEQMAMRPGATWKMIAAYFRISEETLSNIFERQPDARAAYERGCALGEYQIADSLFVNAVKNFSFPAQKMLATNFLGMKATIDPNENPLLGGINLTIMVFDDTGGGAAKPVVIENDPKNKT